MKATRLVGVLVAAVVLTGAVVALTGPAVAQESSTNGTNATDGADDGDGSIVDTVLDAIEDVVASVQDALGGLFGSGSDTTNQTNGTET